MAEIRNGAFRTPPHKGTVGGPHVVRITAGNGQHVEALRPYGMPYGSGEFRLAVELPQAAATHHFELAAADP